MRSLHESQRQTDDAFQTASVWAIDESRSVLYAGSMVSLLVEFGAEVVPAGIYTPSLSYTGDPHMNRVNQGEI